MNGEQVGFDWNRDVNLPVSGRSPRARHAGATGAQVAAITRPMIVIGYRGLIEAAPISDHAAAAALGCGLSTINSLRNALGAHVEASDEYEIHEFRSRIPGGTSRFTKRTKWRWVSKPTASTPSDPAHPGADTSPSTQQTEGEPPTP